MAEPTQGELEAAREARCLTGSHGGTTTVTDGRIGAKPPPHRDPEAPASSWGLCPGMDLPAELVVTGERTKPAAKSSPGGGLAGAAGVQRSAQVRKLTGVLSRSPAEEKG